MDEEIMADADPGSEVCEEEPTPETFVLIRDLKQIATCYKEEHSLPDGKTCTIFRIKTTQTVNDESKNPPREEPAVIKNKVKVLNLSANPALRRLKHLNRPKSLSGNRVFKCRNCSFSCTRSFDLRRHQSTHSGGHDFKCKECDASFQFRASLTVHMKRCHTFEKPYRCKHCDEAFATPREYLNHTEKYHMDRTLLNKSNLPFKSLGIQTDESCKVYIDGKMRYKCWDCENTFTNSTVLKYHILSVHKKIKPFKCSICNTSFARKFDLKKHQRIHSADKAYKCELCLSSFPALGTLTLHMRRFHALGDYGTGRFECDFCKKTLSNRANLKEHILSVHRKERAYKCSICNSAFYRNSLLQRHMLTHSGEKPHRCYMCDVKFAYRYPLARHMRKSHGIEKPYKCDACGLAFLNCRRCLLHKRKCCPKKVSRAAKRPMSKSAAGSSETQRVSVIVSGDSPRQYRKSDELGEDMAPVVIQGTTRFACRICDKTFSNKANVKDHIFSVHRKERTFQCDVCNASFYRNCLLKRHMKSHSGDKPHKCERCNVGFIHKMNLMKHRRTCGQTDKNSSTGTAGGPNSNEHVYQRKYGNLENSSQTGSIMTSGLLPGNETGIASINPCAGPPQVNSDPPYAMPVPMHINHGAMSYNPVPPGPTELNPNSNTTHINPCPSHMNAGPTHMNTGVAHMNPGPTHMNPGPTHMNPGPTHMNPGPTHMNPGPTHMNPGPTHMNPGPTHMNPGPNMNTGPTHMNIGPTHMNTGVAHMNPGPTHMNPGPPIHMNSGPTHMNPGPNMNLGPPQASLGPPQSYPGQSQINPDDIAHLMIEIGNTLFPQTPSTDQLMTVDTSQMYYKCNDCSKYFTSGSELSFHHNSVHASQYRCSICESTFVTNNDLFEHQKSHENERPFSCHLCNARFTLKSSLTVHIRRRHTLERPFKCEICEKPFVTSSEMHAHKKSHFSVKKPTRTKGDLGPNRSAVAVEKRYECSECLKTYTTRSVLKMHILSVHKHIKPFKCTICEAAFSRTSFLKRHMVSHTGEKPFQCALCSTRFTQRGHLNAHVRKFHPLSMENNSSESPRKPSSIRRRLAIHRPYECGMCGKQFSNARVLLLHKDKCYSDNVGQEEQSSGGTEEEEEEEEQAVGGDGGGGPDEGGPGDDGGVIKNDGTVQVTRDCDGYTCNLCGKSFSTLANHLEHCTECYPANAAALAKFKKLESHTLVASRQKSDGHLIQVDISRKRFTCSQCNKSYSTKTVLRTHIMSAHENIRPFQCGLCDAAFARKSYLDRHLISHSGAKPHKCDLCSASYTQKYNLTLHMRKQHELDV